MLNAQEILGTSPDKAKALFAAMGGVAEGFRRLARKWHPDVNTAPEAGTVFRHLVALREIAERGTAAAAAKPGLSRTFDGVDGRTFAMRHLAARATDVGDILVGRSSVAYVVSPDFDDLSPKAAAWVPPFADAKMRSEMERFLPRRIADAETRQGRVLAYGRTEDQILLSDLVAHQGGRVEPVHAAWIASGLMNLCCWLEWAGLSHGWIGPDTLLISPLHHSVALTGPFLFAARLGERPAALPERTLSVSPRSGLPGTTADASLDLELARATVREALGDPGGARLLSGKEVPRPFALWLATPPAKGARQDYAGWEKARREAFGPRRFVEMKVSPRDAYGA